MEDNTLVLIVEDDVTNRLILRSIVKDVGYQFIEAENGQQAIELCLKHNVDIVLMDVMMPVMNGYQSAREIKSKSKPFIPIIFLTALADQDSLAKCIEAGGDDFLTKPYNHVLLRSKIESMLRIRMLYQQVEEQNKALNIHNARIEHEVEVAKNIFSNVLKHDFNGSDTGFRCLMSPVSIFNGDMIIAERNQTDGFDVLIGDFTGHGLSAAIGSLPVADIFYTMTHKGYSFVETIIEINNKLIKLLPTQMFMSSAFVSVDRLNSVVTIVNCGLPDLYLIGKDGIKQSFSSKVVPLGIMSLTHDNIKVDIEVIEFGDRIISATDGLIETTNKDGEMFGKNRMINVIETANNNDNIFDDLLAACNEFSSDEYPADDLTLFEIKHLENIVHKDKVVIVDGVNESEWALSYELDMESIRNFDVLPYMVQGITGLHTIPNGHSTVFTILSEMYSNALDHGILMLDSSIKNTPGGYIDYYQMKSERLAQQEEGSIKISLNHELKPDGGGRLTIRVDDSGEGYNYEDYNLDNMGGNKNTFGRGLALVNSLCESVKIMGKGNSIEAVYDWG
ncbi:MAG: SpoIIE family protein phosphatase [Gammaproteobacteria bacterium]|nr:SpoIIE family protein phosphatase [Gammaproteobacteria bacterium]